MIQDSLPAQAAQAVGQALDQMRAQTPALAEVIAALGPLRAAQAAFKAGLPALEGALPPADPARLGQGQPLADVADFLASPELDPADYLERAAAALLPAIAQGLPALAAGAEALGRILAAGAASARTWLEALLGGGGEALQGLARRAGLAPAALEFIRLELARPLLERRAEALAPLLAGESWPHGTCPICGAPPEMACLRGQEGQRWLRCARCAHQWRFARTCCPVCGNQDQDRMEFFFVEGRERERADCCCQCGRYVLTLDARGLDPPPLWAVAALGLVHLDLLAQAKGLAPAAWTAWNRLG